MMRMRSLEYFAGFFDGEGCISASLSQYTVNERRRSAVIQVRVGHTFKPILDDFAATFGGTVRPRSAGPRGHKLQWVWVLSTKRECALFLLKIRPLLFEKQAQADIALDLLSIKYKIALGDQATNVVQLSRAKCGSIRY